MIEQFYDLSRPLLDADERALALCRELDIRDVALTGGVFMNRLLFDLVRTGLEKDSATVLAPTSIPVNDGCISYGQAAVARARLSAR